MGNHRERSGTMFNVFSSRISLVCTMDAGCICLKTMPLRAMAGCDVHGVFHFLPMLQELGSEHGQDQGHGQSPAGGPRPRRRPSRTVDLNPNRLLYPCKIPKIHVTLELPTIHVASGIFCMPKLWFWDKVCFTKPICFAKMIPRGPSDSFRLFLMWT